MGQICRRRGWRRRWKSNPGRGCYCCGDSIKAACSSQQGQHEHWGVHCGCSLQQSALLRFRESQLSLGKTEGVDCVVCQRPQGAIGCVMVGTYFSFCSAACSTSGKALVEDNRQSVKTSFRETCKASKHTLSSPLIRIYRQVSWR